MVTYKELRNSVLHVLFPHVCDGCGTDIIDEQSSLCMQCIAEMPETNFHSHANNPVEKIFWGRLPVVSATAQYYFVKESLMQHLLHQLKYKGNKELGWQLGRLMGQELQKTNRFSYIDYLVPLPLFASKEKRRGYNQATVLCEGIAEITNTQIAADVIVRTEFTETQTKKGRIERWSNMEGKFQLVNIEKIMDKTLLLIDDVITTGATLEACGLALQDASPKLSIATLCYASR